MLKRGWEEEISSVRARIAKIFCSEFFLRSVRADKMERYGSSSLILKFGHNVGSRQSDRNSLFGGEQGQSGGPRSVMSSPFTFRYLLVFTLYPNYLNYRFP